MTSAGVGASRLKRRMPSPISLPVPPLSSSANPSTPHQKAAVSTTMPARAQYCQKRLGGHVGPPMTLTFLAEIHGDDVRPVFGRHLGAIIVGLVMRFGFGAVVADLELQPEIDRRIDEGGDRGIGDRQDRRGL